MVGVSLSGDPERRVEIELTPAEAGGAEAGDYTLSARSVTFESGETEKSLTVTAVDDAVDDDGVDEEGERVALRIDAAGLPAGVTLGGVTSAVVKLKDDDERGVAVSAAALAVPEGGSGRYTVVLKSEPTAAVTVRVTTALGGTDLEVEPGSLTFGGADWSREQTVEVRAGEDEDALAEPEVVLEHAATGGDYEGAEVSGVVVTVLENDAPTLAIADAAGSESAGVLEFEVSLSTASSETVRVSYRTADGTGDGRAEAGSDYEAKSGVLTFAPGETESRTIEVRITDDAVDEEETETFTVELRGEEHAALGVARATGSIEDDDDPAVTVGFGSAEYTAMEGGAAGVVEVSLSADPERTVEIGLVPVEEDGAEAADYTLSASDGDVRERGDVEGGGGDGGG